MRRSIYAGVAAQACEVFERAAFVHIAGAAEDGVPILRAVHTVVLDGALFFHAAGAGEKLGLADRPVVAMAQEVVAEVPSYAIDPQRACPATTYYRAAQASGVLRTERDPGVKARVLAELMQKFQPEGGYADIHVEDPRYGPAIRGLWVARLGLEHAVAKVKLGQNRRPEQITAVMRTLWSRGLPGDPRAIEVLRWAHPDAATPEFLAAPVGFSLCCAPSATDVEGTVDLLVPTYWNEGVSRRDIERAQHGASAWVCAHDEHGQVVATARAVSDGIRYAYIADVVVARSVRGRGLGRAVLGLLLTHPRVRDAQRVHLVTRDAQPLYEGFGFEALEARPPPWSMMMLRREANP